MTLANSNYEEWRDQNPTAPREEFKFSFSKMSQAGALFDLVKLNDISKNRLCLLDAETVYELVVDWAKEYNEKLYNLLIDDENYAKSIFSIKRGNEKPRKDIAKWGGVENYNSYFYNSVYSDVFI